PIRRDFAMRAQRYGLARVNRELARRLLVPDIDVRKGMPDVELSREEFSKRLRERFYDPEFDAAAPDVERVIEVAWKSYHESHKTPRPRRGGEGFADPNYEISIEWLETWRQIQAAERRQKDPASPSRILIINGSPRSDHTCPGEMSKTWRLLEMARQIFEIEK